MLKLARRARGHFVTLIEIRMHLIRCKPGHISNFSHKNGALQVEKTVCSYYHLRDQYITQQNPVLQVASTCCREEKEALLLATN